MGIPIMVLDKGYVELIEPWGRGRDGVTLDEGGEKGHDYEVGIIEAARQSTQGAFRGWETDAKLLEYLYMSKPRHAGPFEFAGMTIEVQAPIFVFREWHRHRTQSYNEMSARYAPLPEDYFFPDREDVMKRAHVQTRNKQAAGMPDTFLTERDSRVWFTMLASLYDHAQDFYDFGLRAGIPKELARIGMPLGHYSRMRATGNLRNWLAFMTLRCDPGAQQEIRVCAEAVATIIRHTFPRTMELYERAT